MFAALQKSEEREEALYRHLLEVQASNILNELYCGKLRGRASTPREEGKIIRREGTVDGRWLTVLPVRGLVL
jgi:hypothetical protein